MSESKSNILDLPQLAPSTDPWGPGSTVPPQLRFNDVPYAPFSKGDKLGKVADWSSDGFKDGKDQKRQQYGRGFRDPYHAYGASATSFFTGGEADDLSSFSSFSVVDSSRTSAKPRAQNAVLRTRGGRGGAAGRGGAIGGGARNNQGGGRFAPGNRQNDRNQRGGRQGRRFGWKDFEKPLKVRDASVTVTDQWQLIQSIGFNELQKLSFDIKNGSDIDSYGYVYQYNRSLDKPMVNIKLQQLDRVVYNITTSEDPIIQSLADRGEGTVFATDSIISLLMCTTKSVNPWDIIINKSGDKIYFDKREGGPLDFVSVDENAIEPPVDSTDKDNINSSANLAIEATYINHNFAVNAVNEAEPRHDFANSNPFYNPEEDVDPLLARGYRYRSFNLADSPDAEPLKLIIRTEVDAVQTGVNGATDSFITVKALNEYGGPGGALEWKNKFVNQRGAIVAAEMKNNLNKLSRWAVQSILSGASLMKIGFVSRVSPKDNTQHVIVGVLGREPAQFASQINLSLHTGWGIVKSLINIAGALDDGKYVLMKDPNNPSIKLYKVPASTFEDDGEN